ncbi:MAG: cobalamin-dependent protein [Candidatus Binatia bacterium]|nr:cobalamin-dependent protein [Candidatus Binatia bacterium]
MKTTQLDLLLVNAPSRKAVYGKKIADELAAIEPPVWAGLIAAHCMKQGFSVEILDAEARGISVETTANHIIGVNPRLAAFCVYGQQPSASTQCLPGTSAVARLVNQKIASQRGPHPVRVPTLALGTHPSAMPLRTLLEEPFDYVCQGEGPATIVGLLNAFKSGSLDYGTLDAPGLWGRAGSKVVPWEAPGSNITDLDCELPRQAWELLDLTKYRAHNWHLWTGDPLGGYASVQTSLGCPFRCTFCCINAPFGNAGIRHWSPANVVAQISELVYTYGITNIKIPDEMFVLDRRHVIEICGRLISSGISGLLNLWAYARVDTLKDEYMLELMRAAGFRWLGIGIESGSQHVREGSAKGKFTEDGIYLTVERVRAHDICVGANYIFGLPDDTVGSMEATLCLAKALNTEWANFYCAMAYPGSKLHEIAASKGWRLPEDEGGPGWIGYSQHAYETLPLPTETLTAAGVLAFRDLAFLDYFGDDPYQRMVNKKFGVKALAEVRRMVAMGSPKRALLEKGSMVAMEKSQEGKA